MHNCLNDKPSPKSQLRLSQKVRMHLHGDPLEVLKQVLCVLSIQSTTCSARDAAVTRVSVGAGVRKALKDVGRCERMSNSGYGGGRCQGFELTRNLPGRAELKGADLHCANAPTLLCLDRPPPPPHRVCEPGTRSRCLVPTEGQLCKM